MLVRLADVGRRTAGRIASGLFAMLVGCLAVAAGHAATDEIGLLKVRFGGDGRETRLVIEMNGATSAKLVSDGALDRRIVLWLPAVAPPTETQGSGRGVVAGWSTERAQGGTRLTLNLATDATIRRRFLLPPADGISAYRYVMDLAPAPGVVLTSTSITTAPQIRSRLALTAMPVQRTKKVIVVDAGHGGRDSGAQGARGFEKDINLAAALSLAEQLEKTGRYRVVLTRKTDLYIPLESRVRIAQRADADLFISLHSDSGPEPAVRGVSVYTLSEKASQRAQRFASRDDWFMKTSLGGDQGVRDILFDLTQRATRNRSAVFAQTLVSRIEGRAPLLRRSHRDAGFMVLLAPDVPAVLLEMGFVSNDEDETRLRDPAGRARLMRAVTQAIDDHFSDNLKLAAR